MTKDTNHTIFGYSWEDIQARQMKRYHPTALPSNSPLPVATGADRELLAQHGSIEALKSAGLFGVVDRLSREVL